MDDALMTVATETARLQIGRNKPNPASMDLSKVNTYWDYRVHTHARAVLAHLTDVRFALDHEKGTARVLTSFPSEVPPSGIWGGVHALIEPWAEHHDRDLRLLGGKTLRLMGWPFSGDVYYTITTDTSEGRF